MLEMFLAIALVLVCLLIWYYYPAEESKTEEKPATGEKSASETAAANIAAAEAAKNVAGGAGSVSAGSAGSGNMPPGAIITPTTSNDVAKTATVPAQPSAPIVPPPIVPNAPVTASLANQPPATANALAAIVPNYTFNQGMTFGGNDIANTGWANDVPKLAAWCDANASCKGFTTDAWMKSKIPESSTWTKWTIEPTKGLYVKK